MRRLLDSHALLWYTLGDSRLSGATKALILDADHEVLISPATYWEIAIKVSIGKLNLHQPYEDFIDACLSTYRFTILPVGPKHTARVVGLPFHHKDPFDRLLVAQALVEEIPIISNDPALDAYGVTGFGKMEPKHELERSRQCRQANQRTLARRLVRSCRRTLACQNDFAPFRPAMNTDRKRRTPEEFTAPVH